MNNASHKPLKYSTVIFWATFGVFVLMCFVYGYLFHTIRQTGLAGAALEAETSTLEDQASEAGEIKKNLSLIQARQPVLASYFIDASDIVPFLETIEGYGRQTNVTTKFNTFTFKRAPDMLAVSMVADGSFTDLYHFMALLEAAPYEITMTSADVQAQLPKGLKPDEQSAAVTGWEAQINLSITSITNVPKDAVKATAPKK